MDRNFSAGADGPKRRRPRRRAPAVPLAGLSFALLATGVTAAAPVPNASPGLSAAMARMHHAMDIRGTGDPDRDFALMMIPHHQGAIDMARVELLNGKDERLRRLAQGIIVEQGQEIEAMRTVLSGSGSGPPGSGSGS